MYVLGGMSVLRKKKDKKKKKKLGLMFSPGSVNRVSLKRETDANRILILLYLLHTEFFEHVTT